MSSKRTSSPFPFGRRTACSPTAASATRATGSRTRRGSRPRVLRLSRMRSRKSGGSSKHRRSSRMNCSRVIRSELVLQGCRTPPRSRDSRRGRDRRRGGGRLLRASRRPPAARRGRPRGRRAARAPPAALRGAGTPLRCRRPREVPSFPACCSILAAYADGGRRVRRDVEALGLGSRRVRRSAASILGGSGPSRGRLPGATGCPTSGPSAARTRRCASGPRLRRTVTGTPASREALGEAVDRGLGGTLPARKIRRVLVQRDHVDLQSDAARRAARAATASSSESLTPAIRTYSAVIRRCDSSGHARIAATTPCERIGPGDRHDPVARLRVGGVQRDGEVRPALARARTARRPA